MGDFRDIIQCDIAIVACMENVHVAAGGLVLPPTPLVEVPAIAERCGVARVLLKLESKRPLGNFKVLGGLYASLKLLAAIAGTSVEDLCEQRVPIPKLPALLCASDGNHGLAVATAAGIAGTTAVIFLHRNVGPVRAARIESAGGRIRWIEGTYDDAVDAARLAAEAGDGLLIPDTSDQLDDPVVALVMEGYGVLVRELVAQLAHAGAVASHVFVQAGVGGLAASVAAGISPHMGRAKSIVVVEPDQAACVGRALGGGQIVRIDGNLDSTAAMLACGEASASAVAILRAHHAVGVSVSDAELSVCVESLDKDLGIQTTASGAAGLAGLIQAAADPLKREALRLTPASTVVLFITEGP
jgi:diaminopropionate ammonia-lyase